MGDQFAEFMLSEHGVRLTELREEEDDICWIDYGLEKLQSRRQVI